MARILLPFGLPRSDVRVAEGARLESVWGFTPLLGSNPSRSALSSPSSKQGPDARSFEPSPPLPVRRGTRDPQRHPVRTVLVRSPRRQPGDAGDRLAGSYAARGGRPG